MCPNDLRPRGSACLPIDMIRCFFAIFVQYAAPVCRPAYHPKRTDPWVSQFHWNTARFFSIFCLPSAFISRAFPDQEPITWLEVRLVLGNTLEFFVPQCGIVRGVVWLFRRRGSAC